MQYDLLIIGSGIAALSLVFHLKEQGYDKKIIIASDNSYENSNSYKAQGGVALEFGDSANKSQHIQDTLQCGIINNLENTSTILNQAEIPFCNLIHSGLELDKDENGNFLKRKEAGHSSRRIFYHEDTSGKHIQQYLYSIVSKLDNLEMLENKFCYELIANNNMCKGAKFIDKLTNSMEVINANIVVIATGGCGSLYQYTSNSQTTIGSGVALAKAVGTNISNMEFIQFHPTVFIQDGVTLLLSEALRGEGAKIVSHKIGKLKGVELFTRDKLSRLLFGYLQEKHRLYLDCTKIATKKLDHFKFIGNTLKEFGYDIYRELIPIQPAAHYMCGGISTDYSGRTNVQNLYAIGEVADTGLHGANRLASNSLTEAITVPYLLAKQIAELKFPKVVSKGKNIGKKEKPLPIDFSSKIELLKTKMWENCGLVRDDKKLRLINDYINLELDTIIALHSLNYSGQYYKKMLETCSIIISASLKRDENVGTFWKSNLKQKNNFKI